MESIGAEVGQKMRSAIKAKLLELNCYVEIYKKATKRKSNDLPDVKVKKRKEGRGFLKTKKADLSPVEAGQSQSLTDDLPINVNQLSEQRKITIVNENRTNDHVFDDNFDIPLLSEVNMSSEKDLEDIEKKIRNVKSRLGLLVDSDIEEELPEIKTEKVEIQQPNKSRNSKDSNYRVVQIQEELVTGDTCISKNAEPNISKTNENEMAVTKNSPNCEKKNEHKRITFEEDSLSKKPSILERLGKRSLNYSDITNSVKTRISLSEFRKEEEPFLKYFRDSKKEETSKQTEKDWRTRKDHRIDKSRRERGNRRGSSRERRRDVPRDRRRDRSSETRIDSRKESILSRLGVMSKISLPQKEPEEPEPEDELKTREVRSMVQVKPRVIPSGAPQPNKNLLLKAVAEAQRSVAQTPKVGSHLKPESLYGNKYTDIKTKSAEDVPFIRKFSQSEKTKLKNLILAQAVQREKQNSSDDDKAEEYIPKPIKNIPKEAPRYIPSSRQEGGSTDENGEINQQFIITLDGIEKIKILNNESKIPVKARLSSPGISKSNIKSRLDGKRSPSPIIFDKITTKVNSKSNIPDKLPIVHPPLSIKNKERCKYWPSCRQGDKCEFVHPCSNCEMFPHCKFGDKCLYLHPTCKFGSSCTKRECPYSHTLTTKSVVSRVTSSGVPVKHIVAALQTCKFFPNCTNTSCSFYHPKPCKFGKYCKSQSDCNFSHAFASKSSLIWRSK
ncbi:hypothetical protein NQ314_003254 [Rhamnusium bicolor]|uniref:Zinc finger CCCH domain-containing protein 14 n=1 Tax=Rhamnusium bicolor TaxID=1586634 RepID=A0AAV8ZP35_9CUCU|nr:hypothetical protein NQ314_003254 [Rhamnusium bicolor]